MLDEISMINQKDFEQLEIACRVGREDPRIFGGLQVIAAGDFHQLKPVPNDMFIE